MAPRDFPETFLFGAATSSHQVEGDNTNNDWWAWEARPGTIVDGGRSGRAAEWWDGRAEDDLARAASLGHNAHRMSLEWSRLEPEPGRFDPAAFDRYRAILDAARRHGLRVSLTLYHFTLPRWAAQSGGWLDPALVHRFETFAGRAASELGDRVAQWATINEPMILAYQSYGGTTWPPGRGDLRECYQVLARLLDAHARAYRAIHRASRSPAKADVGLVLNLPAFFPSRESHPLDRAVTAAQDWAFNGVVLHALARDRLVPPLAYVPRAMPGLSRTYDWLGLNFYGAYEVRFDPRSPATLMGRHVQEPTIAFGHVDWGKPSPEGMCRQLERLAQLGVPLYVTENGIHDPKDELRADYLISHLRALAGALRGGLDVRGYFVWSLIDNFEWAEGWGPRFGLLALDRDTQARTPRASAQIFAEVCRSGRVGP
ncbi:MAG: family 1 glycosylhydrolase [Sandaracinaceae bacterium]|nr:family 1 glycosylhydrolase [Sandaracinaceae bacterium]